MSSSSESSRLQDQYRKLRSKSQHRRGPERSLTIGDTPIEVVPKDPTLYSSLGWTRDATHLMNWFLYMFLYMRGKISLLRDGLRSYSEP